jgi:cell division protein FtsA
MQNNNQQTFIGLDVGTSAVRCIVGMIDVTEGGNPRPSIIGHGYSANIGTRKGTVVHVDDTTEAIVQAITEAERISGVQINRATVNVNGAHVEGMDSRGVIAISSMNKEISPEDRMRVEEAATVIKMPANREIIQFFAKNYSLDGQRNIKDPVGMQGVRLEVDAHIVTAATPNLRNLDAALEKAQVAPTHHTLSSLAAAEAVLNRQQKEAGTVVLDIGAGTTNLIVVEDGEVQHVAVLEFGGMHLTHGMAIQLKTELEVAESVKVQHASLKQEGVKSVASVKDSDGKMQHFPMDDVKMICEAWAEELFDIVKQELDRAHKAGKLPGGAVLAGGASKLPGLADFAKEQLQLPARVGKLQSVTGLADTVDDPSYYTVIGLMLLDMLLLPEQMQSANFGAPNSKAFGFVEGLLNRFRH